MKTTLSALVFGLVSCICAGVCIDLGYSGTGAALYVVTFITTCVSAISAMES